MQYSSFLSILSAVTILSGPASAVDVDYATPGTEIESIRSAVLAGDSIRVSSLLPASYEKALSGLLNEVAKKADPEMWDALTKLLAGAAKNLAPCSLYLTDIANESVPEALQDKDAAALNAVSLQYGLESFAKFLESDLASQKSFQTKSIAELEEEAEKRFPPKNTAAFYTPKMIDQMKKTLAVKNVETVSDGLCNVTLDIPGFDPESQQQTFSETVVSFTKIDGRWVPEELAKHWKEFVDGATEAVGKLDFNTPEMQGFKGRFLMAAPMLTAGFDQLKSVKTKEEFQEKLGGLAFPAMMLIGGGN